VNRRLKDAAAAVLDLAIRPLLAPFVRPRPRPQPAADAAIEQAAGEFNRAAEQYYAGADPAHLTGKPFTESETFAKRLTDVGVIADALRLRPGDVVLELGAGACWLSHFLNRFGCRTIAVDVSPTALAMGRTLFEQDPRTNWTLAPQFLAYDGHTLPVAAGVADAAILYDTFHHLPNPRAILKELRRVLRPDGVVAMSEPGRGHSKSAGSALEAASTGVLERELVLEEIAADALAAGFTAARVVIAPASAAADGGARHRRRRCIDVPRSRPQRHRAHHRAQPRRHDVAGGVRRRRLDAPGRASLPRRRGHGGRGFRLAARGAAARRRAGR